MTHGEIGSTYNPAVYELSVDRPHYPSPAEVPSHVGEGGKKGGKKTKATTGKKSKCHRYLAGRLVDEGRNGQGPKEWRRAE